MKLRSSLVTVCRASLLAGALLVRGPVAAAEPPPLAEHQIKALYLFNFTKYVEWPVPATAAAPFTIGISGAPEVKNDLLEITRGKRVQGREIVVRSITLTQDVKVCQLVFIGMADKPRIRELLQRVQDTAVLTVGEADNFLALGGMVNFVRQENKLRLEIGLDAVQRARLVMSAKLLAVAGQVKGRVEPPRK
jgi:hypothetical protein